MTREQIEAHVIDLMREFGPDGHIDGYEEITGFVMSLLARQSSCYRCGQPISETPLCAFCFRDAYLREMEPK